jgi:hypothetical protein
MSQKGGKTPAQKPPTTSGLDNQAVMADNVAGVAFWAGSELGSVAALTVV